MQALSAPPTLYTSSDGELPPVPRSSHGAGEGQVVPVESARDYIGKDDFLRVLAAFVLTLSQEERYSVVESVIQFNLKDGIEIASRVGFSPSEMVGLLAFSQQVRALHPDAHASFREELERVSRDLNDSSKKVIQRASDPLRNAIRSSDTEGALELITKHYEELWADKVFRTPSQSTQDPKLVHFLKEIVRACEPHYYTGPIKEKIKGILGVGTTDEIREDLKRVNFPCEDLLSANEIPQSMVSRLARIYGLKAETFTTNVNRSVPFGLVYNTQRALLQEKLTTQVKDSLVHRSAVERERVTFSEKWDPLVDGKRVPSRERKERGGEQTLDEFERFNLELPAGAKAVTFAVSPDQGRVLASYKLGEECYLTDGREATVLLQGVEEVSLENVGKGFAVKLTDSSGNQGVLHIGAGINLDRYIEGPLGQTRENLALFRNTLADSVDKGGMQLGEYRASKHLTFDYIGTAKEVNGRLAYAAKREEKWCFVNDGAEGTFYDNLGGAKEINGKLAYRAKRGDKWCIVYDGVEGIFYDDIRWLVEINGKLAYQAEREGKWCIVNDGVEGTFYDDLGDPKEINGKLAYQAKRGDKWCIVSDGVEGDFYDYVGQPVEINGKLAYKARRGDKWCIVFDGVEGTFYDDTGDLKQINGKLTYRAKRGGKWCIVFDEVEGTFYDDTGDLKQINGKLAYAAQREGKWCIVYDGVEGAFYDDVRDPVEVNGKLAYRARKGDKWCLVVDDREGPLFPNESAITKVGRSFVYHTPTETADGELVWALYNAEHTLQDYIIPDSLKASTSSVTYRVEKNNRQFIKRLKVNTSPTLTLTEEDRKLINLLRLISGQYTTASTLKRIAAILNPEPKSEISIVGSLMAGLKKLGVVRHKGVHGVSLSRIAENLFPELREAKERRLREQGRASISRPLGDTGNYQVGSGNPLAQEESKQRAHTKYRGALVNSLYGEFDPISNQWKPYTTSIELLGETKEHEVTVTGAQGTSGWLLAPFNAEVDPKSIEGAHVVDASSGIPIVQVTASSLRYTTRVGSKVNVGSNPDWDTYKRVMSSSADTRKLLIDLAPENEELSQLAASLRRDTPLATAAAIQSYVREAMYYDHAAVEVNSVRDTLAPAKRISAMEERLKALLSEGATGIGVKRYAGVCADAGILTTTLMRKVGLAAGLAATSDPNHPSGHLCSFACMPAVNKPTTIVVQVDGTPGSGNSVTDSVRGFDLSEYLEQAQREESGSLQPAAFALTEVLDELLSGASSHEGSREVSEELRRQLNFLFTVRVSATSKAVALDVLGQLFWGRSNKSDVSVSDGQRAMLKGRASRNQALSRSVERDLEELMVNSSRVVQARGFYQKLLSDPAFPLFDVEVISALRILIEKVSV